jgi:hypothetical protein
VIEQLVSRKDPVGRQVDACAQAIEPPAGQFHSGVAQRRRQPLFEGSWFFHRAGPDE